MGIGVVSGDSVINDSRICVTRSVWQGLCDRICVTGSAGQGLCDGVGRRRGLLGRACQLP